MYIFFIFLLVSFIIFLFCLYATGKDDIIFIRKNVSIEDLFNYAFLAAVVGVLSARVLHAIVSFNPEYLNPLVFLLIPYFPGLSLSAGIFGAALFLIVTLRYKKMPVGRMLDYYALALLAAMPVGFIGSFFLYKKLNLFVTLYLPIVYVILFLFFLKVIFPRVIRNDIKSGTLGMFFLFTYSFISLFINLIDPTKKIVYIFGIEDGIALLFFIGSLIILIKQEMFTLPGKK